MSAKTTLVIRPGALGDAILTLPFLSAVKREPGGPLIVLGTPGSWAFLRPDAELRVMDFGAPAWLGLFADGVALSDEARRILDDTKRAFVFLKDDGGALERRLKHFGVEQVFCSEPPISNAENVGAGIESARVLVWRRNLLPKQHAACLLSATGAEDASEWLAVTDAERAYADQFLNAMRRKYAVEKFVALHPGSGGRRKCWPAYLFSDLATLFYLELNWFPLILFGPADERVRAEFVQSMPSGAKWAVLDAHTLRELLAVLGGCHLAVTNDSGIAHLAARATRTIAIFGPTNPNVWAPVGDGVATIQAPQGNLDLLSVDTVFAAATGAYETLSEGD